MNPAINVSNWKAQPSAQNMIMLGRPIFQKFADSAVSFLPRQNTLKERKKEERMSYESMPSPKTMKNLSKLEMDVAKPMALMGSEDMRLSMAYRMGM